MNDVDWSDARETASVRARMHVETTGRPMLDLEQKELSLSK